MTEKKEKKKMEDTVVTTWDANNPKHILDLRSNSRPASSAPPPPPPLPLFFQTPPMCYCEARGYIQFTAGKTLIKTTTSDPPDCG